MRERETTMNDVKIMAPAVVHTKPSAMRKLYIWKLTGRILVLLAAVFLWRMQPSFFRPLEAGQFFRGFSLLHLLWAAWMMDMLLQVVYVKKHVPLGSQKLFRQRYVPARGKVDHFHLKEYMTKETKAAYKIFLLWAAAIGALGALHHAKVIDDVILFLISTFFYVCDLICVLIWCPFRIFMKNRCCTTCRIFNWDHLMMFSPLLFVDGFYARSLVIMAFAVWMLWEYAIMAYPDRFWEQSNEALQCSSCTDKLCSQYCGKPVK